MDSHNYTTCPVTDHQVEISEKNLEMNQENKIPYVFTMDDPMEVLEFRILDQNGKITKNSIKAALKPPYPLKYYITCVLSVVGLTVFLLWNYGVIFGFHQGFYCHDPLFSHKYTGDTITPTILGIGLVLIFLLTYFIVEYARQGRFKETFRLQNLLEFYIYFKHLLIAQLLVGAVTEIAKTIVGEHRPHFFDICMPDTNFNCTDGTYIPTYTCTNNDVTYLQIIDASRSFPSGHSSLSWTVALFCAYIVHSRLPVKRTGTVFKIFLLIICMAFGLICSLTRITDRRHHWWDVLTGTVLAVLGTAYVILVTEKKLNMLKKQMRITEERMTRGVEIDYDV